MLEVELKACLEGIDRAELEERSLALGFRKSRSLRETDTYYQGIDRDFRKTDEALRLRCCSTLPQGPKEILLTYKGPKCSPRSSARTEYEVAVSQQETAHAILRSLGFTPACTVDKLRTEYRLGSVTLCLDLVTGLGLYLELELLVEQEADRPAAEAQLLALLDQLQLSRDRLTRTSYLELLEQAVL